MHTSVPVRLKDELYKIAVDSDKRIKLEKQEKAKELRLSIIVDCKAAAHEGKMAISLELNEQWNECMDEVKEILESHDGLTVIYHLDRCPNGKQEATIRWGD